MNSKLTASYPAGCACDQYVLNRQRQSEQLYFVETALQKKSSSQYTNSAMPSPQRGIKKKISIAELKNKQSQRTKHQSDHSNTYVLNLTQTGDNTLTTLANNSMKVQQEPKEKYHKTESYKYASPMRKKDERNRNEQPVCSTIIVQHHYYHHYVLMPVNCNNPSQVVSPRKSHKDTSTQTDEYGYYFVNDSIKDDCSPDKIQNKYPSKSNFPAIVASPSSRCSGDSKINLKSIGHMSTIGDLTKSSSFIQSNCQGSLDKNSAIRSPGRSPRHQKDQLLSFEATRRSEPTDRAEYTQQNSPFYIKPREVTSEVFSDKDSPNRGTNRANFNTFGPMQQTTSIILDPIDKNSAPQHKHNQQDQGLFGTKPIRLTFSILPAHI